MLARLYDATPKRENRAFWGPRRWSAVRDRPGRLPEALVWEVLRPTRRVGYLLISAFADRPYKGKDFFVSKTQSVTYEHNGFWAYDVAAGVFLKYLIDAAQASAEANTPWLSKAVLDWRVWAVVGDFEIGLGENWPTEQRATFVGLAEKACSALAARNSISAEEIVNWHFVDDYRIHTRGTKEVATAPVIELGRAMIALVCGELPQAPKGEAWIFGLPEGRSTIRMDASWDGRWS